MDNDFRYKIIIEPVHGDIGLSKLETELINTPTFQRLKGIKQLGFAHTVYPSAKHTRFEHSLGVMHIMGRVIDNTCEELGKEDIQKLRVAALLHDVGHYPYSHVMEKIDWDSAKKYMKKKQGDGNRQNDIPQKYPSHEDLGKIVITERKDIKGILKSNGIDPKEIASLIKGEHQNLPNLLNRSFDIDRLDYLARDSISTGLPYGKVDINYIVNNLELIENEVVVRAKARNAVEHMLIARYFMFNTLYMHKTVFAFEEIIRRIILMLLEKGHIYKSGGDIKNIARRSNSRKFLAFHDGYINSLIDKYASNKKDKVLATLCQAIKYRKPPKLVYAFGDLVANGKIMKEHSNIHSKSKSNWDDKVPEFVTEFKIPEELWFFSNINGASFEKRHPFVSLADTANLDPGEIKELVRIKETSGEIKNLVTDKSSILHYLSRLKPTLLRIYVVGIDDTKAQQIKGKIKEWLQS